MFKKVDKKTHSFSRERELIPLAERPPAGSHLTCDGGCKRVNRCEPDRMSSCNKRRGCVVVLQEMENAWNEYSRLERDVDWLKAALQAQMNRSDLSQVRGGNSRLC